MVVCSSIKTPWCSSFSVRTKLCKDTCDLDMVGSPWILTLAPSRVTCRHKFPQFINESPKVASHWKPKTTSYAPSFSGGKTNDHVYLDKVKAKVPTYPRRFDFITIANLNLKLIRRGASNLELRHQVNRDKIMGGT